MATGLVAEMRQGLGIEDFDIYVVGVAVGAWLEEAVVHSFGLAAAHGCQDGILGADPLWAVGSRACILLLPKGS